MAYIAYRDKQKNIMVNAKDTTISDTKKIFYCKTSNCNACMGLVNGADPNRAYFRRLPSSPKHCSILCSADGNFDPIQYDEGKFDFDIIAEKIMNGEIVSDNYSKFGGIDESSGKKTLTSVYQIYLMCRKYESYNGWKTGEILADERNFSRYQAGIGGSKIVQCTPYHKIKDEYAYLMNYPLFPYKVSRYIRIDFASEKLFWGFYNKVKTSNHKELVIILGKWEKAEYGEKYIAKCRICRERQIHFLKNGC